MNKKQADSILSSMIAFIEQHGKEEVDRIEKSMNDDFTVGKNQYVEDEKKKIEKNYETELKNQQVKLKIEKSKQQNMARIERVRKVNEYIDQLKQAMKQEVREKFKNDKAAYKKLMKDLLIQVSIYLS